MGLKPDHWIAKMVKEHGMIKPFVNMQVRYVSEDKTRFYSQLPAAPMCYKCVSSISFGVSSYGYDIRVGREFRIAKSVWPQTVDPKNFLPHLFQEVNRDDHIVIPPHGFALARSVEHFKIPRNVLTVCLGKSTYARCGIIVNVTPFEPEWQGYVTLEISNTLPLPAKVYVNEGIAQVLFFEADEECTTSYADKKGIYQNQEGITPPRTDHAAQ